MFLGWKELRCKHQKLDLIIEIGEKIMKTEGWSRTPSCSELGGERRSIKDLL